MWNYTEILGKQQSHGVTEIAKTTCCLG